MRAIKRGDGLVLQGLRGGLTYANVMATVAVFIALGGASYAAVKLPKNSVGSSQIKKNAVTGSRVRNSSLTRVGREEQFAPRAVT